MDKKRILVLNSIANEGLILFDHNYEIGPEVNDPHGIVVRSGKVDTDLYPNLLAVARAGAGVNNITVDKASERGVCVFNTPGANANAVAELVFIMLGISARNIHQGLDFCRELIDVPVDQFSSRVESQKKKYRGFELAGRTLGVIGLGKIGVRVANSGILHGMKVLGFDPYPALGNIHQLSPDVQLCRSLPEVLVHSNILSVHVPLNDKTRGLINKSILSRLPPDAILVNYARGEIVDQTAVLEALDGGQLNSYITDFPSPELVANPKVLASPHLGASTEESEEHCAVMAVSELKGYLEFGNITHSVNFPIAESIPSDKVHSRLIMINRDIPDMIGFVSHTIGSQGINIASYLNESNGTIGYNIIDVESEVPPEVIVAIESHPGVIRTRVIPFTG